MPKLFRRIDIKKWARGFNWKKSALWGGLGILGLFLLVQVFYPSDRLLPLASIDGQPLGWQAKSDAIQRLNEAYRQHTVEIKMGDQNKNVSSPNLDKAGIVVDNTTRINEVSYPWYLRIVPTSLLWAHLSKTEVPAPSFGEKTEKYIDNELMPACKESPVDATLRADGGKLVPVDAKPGGQCERSDVAKTIKEVRPNLEAETKVVVTLKVLQPAIGIDVAKVRADELNARIGDGVVITAGGETVTIPATGIASWMDFASQDNDIVMTLNADRSREYLEKTIAPKVAVAPGVSRVTTVDFTETSRVNGANGQALDMAATLGSLTQFLTGQQAASQAITKVIPPTVQYTRSYSPTDAGLSALLANYAKDHPGTFGISLIELGGKKRRANHNGDRQFVTASTYKLFVAYSLLKRIDNGSRDWASDGDCFNKMISLSDNPCSENFLKTIGLGTISREMSDIGLKNSTFMKTGGPFTTANDLALLLGMIESGQGFSPTNRERLISAMLGNVYRKGIPAGASGRVADKVGFLNNLLHDAAIVYSPNGTYVLAVMTEDSSWAAIADLAKQIDTLRSQ